MEVFINNYYKFYLKCIANLYFLGLQSLRNTAIELLVERPERLSKVQSIRYPNLAAQKDNETPKINTPKSASSKTFSFLFTNENSQNEYADKEHTTFTLKTEINKEIELFGKIIKDAHFINTTDSTTKFWRENKFPLLLKVAAILLNIPSSSAFVERFFSLCGIISTVRNANMKDELLIIRSMLKVNMNILLEMKTIQKSKFED